MWSISSVPIHRLVNSVCLSEIQSFQPKAPAPYSAMPCYAVPCHAVQCLQLTASPLNTVITKVKRGSTAARGSK